MLTSYAAPENMYFFFGILYTTFAVAQLIHRETATYYKMTKKYKVLELVAPNVKTTVQKTVSVLSISWVPHSASVFKIKLNVFFKFF